MIVLWQWSTPSRLTPATSLPSLLVRHSGRTSLMVRSVISWYLAWSGDLVFHWKLVNCCPSVHRCRVLPLSGICGDLGETLGGEMFGPSGRFILFKLSQNESGGTAYNTACSFFYWVHCGRSSCFLIIVLFTDIQMLNTHLSLSVSSLIFLLSTLSNTYLRQASRESLSSSLSGDVSEAGLSSTQGALGAPVMPQPSGSHAAVPAPVPATPSKVGHWQ